MNIRGRLWLAVAFSWVAAFLVIWWFATGGLPKFYEEKMRASLFTAFFTLSGFLLSAKSFIVLNLKKEMLSTKTYIERVREQAQLTKDKRISVYQPLRNIGDALMINVVLCLACSACQFTIGLLDCPAATAVCLAAAATAGGMLAFSLWLITANLHELYDHFETEAQEAITNAAAAIATDRPAETTQETSPPAPAVLPVVAPSETSPQIEAVPPDGPPPDGPEKKQKKRGK